MARRYGRNQRRRARELIAHQHEELASLHEAIHRESRQLQAETQKAQALKQVLDEARYILGDTSALPPQRCKHQLDDGQRSFEASPQAPFSLEEFEKWSALETTTTTIARMHALLVTVEERKSGTGRIHCLVQLANQTWAYAISDDALRTMPTDALRRRIGREIAQQLGDHLPPTPRGTRLHR